MTSNNDIWPQLPLSEWKDTYETLHRWTQIVGKIRLALAPLENHWWNTTLYINSRGLTTSAMPYNNILLQIDFDFIDHILHIHTSLGDKKTIILKPRTVSEFYKEILYILAELDIYVPVWSTPVEIQDRTPFEEDIKHTSYDPEQVIKFWKILSQTSRIFTEFRSRFMGKVSPIHFFWGAFDLAVTRFSGRTAPIHQGAPNMAHFIAIEAYSQEVSSCGFWPGGGPIDEPIFYSYAYPEPDGYKEYQIQPVEAKYSKELNEFILPYNVVRTSEFPDRVLTTFLESTYNAAANLAKWNRNLLERQM